MCLDCYRLSMKHALLHLIFLFCLFVGWFASRSHFSLFFFSSSFLELLCCAAIPRGKSFGMASACIAMLPGYCHSCMAIHTRITVCGCGKFCKISTNNQKMQQSKTTTRKAKKKRKEECVCERERPRESHHFSFHLIVYTCLYIFLFLFFFVCSLHRSMVWVSCVAVPQFPHNQTTPTRCFHRLLWDQHCTPSVTWVCVPFPKQQLHNTHNRDTHKHRHGTDGGHLR
jgi:hypothetical protein